MPSPVVPRRFPLAVLLFFASSLWSSLVCAQDATAAQRQKMVEQIAAIARVMGGSSDTGTLDPRVMATMAAVPRHEFVPAEQKPHAYDDRPLPIGHGQTISQPYMVAAMTALMKPMAEHVVLEIGTGSGYQAAVLAGLVRAVYSIEIVDALARQAAERLARLGYGNVTTKSGDGYYGWPEHGPFDSIMVTAASSHIPPPLLRQLKPGGRMVIPIGAPFMTQQLMLVEKNADGTVTTRQMMAVRFVPLTGSH
jgi:protein-L-isoaspartate(D-aspartate) O-methyltransferase